MVHAITDGSEVLAVSHSLVDMQELLLDLTMEEIYSYWLQCVNIWGEDPYEVSIPTMYYFYFYLEEIPYF